MTLTPEDIAELRRRAQSFDLPDVEPERLDALLDAYEAHQRCPKPAFSAGPSHDALWLVQHWERLSGRPYGTTAADDMHVAQRLIDKAKGRQLAEQWLRAWLADQWVREKRPKLRHLEDNLQRYAAVDGPSQQEQSAERAADIARLRNAEIKLRTLLRVGATHAEVTKVSEEIEGLRTKLKSGAGGAG